MRSKSHYAVLVIEENQDNWRHVWTERNGLTSSTPLEAQALFDKMRQRFKDARYLLAKHVPIHVRSYAHRADNVHWDEVGEVLATSEVVFMPMFKEAWFHDLANDKD